MVNLKLVELVGLDGEPYVDVLNFNDFYAFREKGSIDCYHYGSSFKLLKINEGENVDLLNFWDLTKINERFFNFWNEEFERGIYNLDDFRSQQIELDKKINEANKFKEKFPSKESFDTKYVLNYLYNSKWSFYSKFWEDYLRIRTKFSWSEFNSFRFENVKELVDASKSEFGREDFDFKQFNDFLKKVYSDFD